MAVLPPCLISSSSQLILESIRLVTMLATLPYSSRLLGPLTALIKMLVSVGVSLSNEFWSASSFNESKYMTVPDRIAFFSAEILESIFHTPFQATR